MALPERLAPPRNTLGVESDESTRIDDREKFGTQR
jgi:hypothetical protein